MDPRNFLWLRLIFKHLPVEDLFALRLVCPAFCFQLRSDEARPLWATFIMYVPWMRYDERLLGWAGVDRAMQRARRTQDNCAAGIYLRGPSLDLQLVEHIHIVCGKVILERDQHVIIKDVCTGAIVKHRLGKPSGDIYKVPIMDRWLVCRGNRAHSISLLDCETTEYIPLTRLPNAIATNPNTVIWGCAYSVAGPYVSYRFPLHTVTSIARVEHADNNAIVFRQVKCVRHDNPSDSVFMCERGRSYLLHQIRREGNIVSLHDTLSGQCKRVFNLSAVVERVNGINHIDECGYFTIGGPVTNCSGTGGHYSVSIRDGTWSSTWFGNSHSWIHDRGRIHGDNGNGYYEASLIVDAISGGAVRLPLRGGSICDTSSGVMIQPSRGGQCTSHYDYQNNDGHDLGGLALDYRMYRLHYGACVMHYGGFSFIVRFDEDVALMHP